MSEADDLLSGSSHSSRSELSFSVDITEICSNIKYRQQVLMMNPLPRLREDPKDLDNWRETPDPGDAWYDLKKNLEKYAFYGEKRRNDRPIRNFVTNLLGIKSVAERDREDEEVQALLEKYPQRDIEIYNMTALITYLGRVRGVTLPPNELVPVVRVRKIEKRHKKFKIGRESFLGTIDKKVQLVDKAVDVYEMCIKKRVRFLSEHDAVTTDPETRSLGNMRSANSKRKKYAKRFASRIKSVRNKYNDMGTSFWAVSCAAEDANIYLFKFMLKYIPNLCKLNLVPTGEAPSIWTE